MEKSGASERGSGVPFDEILQLKLSGSLRGAVEEARRWGEHERLAGLFGTGMMFLSLMRLGAKSTPSAPLYAPRFLYDQVHVRSGGAFDVVAERFLDANRLPSGTKGAWLDLMSPNLWRAFEHAATLPSHDQVLAARHLIVALLTAKPTASQARLSVAAILADAGVDRDALLGEFLQSLATRGQREEREDWARLAASHQPPPQSSAANMSNVSSAANVSNAADVAAPPPRGPLIAGYHSDTPTGRAEDDCLDLDASVNAIANLIASTQLDGTLSLGVFGNWGSGKSFFMRRLRGEVDAIASAARADHDGASPVYWSSIAQVEFNAWHYVDANLWASLMSHLLDVLRRWDASGKPATNESGIAQAIEKLEITASAKQAAETRQRAAEAAQQAAADALAGAKREYGAAAEELGQLLARSVWSFVEEKIDPKRKEAATKALRDLGLVADGAKVTAEALYAQARDVASTSGRLHTIAHQLLRDSDGAPRLVWWAAGVIAAIAAIVVASIWAEWLRNAAVVVSTTIAGFAAVAGKALTWVQRTAGVVHEKLAPLREARAAIEQRLAAAEAEKAVRIAQAEKELAMRRADVDVAATQVAAREQDLRAAVLAVGDAISGRAVRQFIEQRLAAGDYQKHLGLIATIRRDFEQLSDLIRAHNCSRRQLHDEKVAITEALLRARPELDQDSLVRMFENIGINRVVLYIDDLDRCPSSRVVEVLQAIHLLVSFPIFVVVVGVDSRWMAHSLAREYPALLTHAQDAAGSVAGWSRDDAQAS